MAQSEIKIPVSEVLPDAEEDMKELQRSSRRIEQKSKALSQEISHFNSIAGRYGITAKYTPQSDPEEDTA